VAGLGRGGRSRAALVVLRKWIACHGVPAALYTDCNTVYWSKTALENPQLRDRRQIHSEFGRVAAGNLGIDLIAAHSPQAKGRVERANGREEPGQRDGRPAERRPQCAATCQREKVTASHVGGWRLEIGGWRLLCSWTHAIQPPTSSF